MERKYATEKDWEYLKSLVMLSGKEIADCYGNKLEDQLVGMVATDKDLIEKYIEDGKDLDMCYCRGETLLSMASRFNKSNEIVKLLIDNGANVNSMDDRKVIPLHGASAESEKAVVEFLLDSGADVNARSDIGITPLHCACTQGNEEIVKLLLDRGAQISAKTERRASPIYNACYHDHKRVVELLLERGADVNCVDKYGNTLLNVACGKEKEDLVRLLIDRKISINTVNSAGESPLAIACSFKNKNIVKILVDEGADVNIVGHDGYTPLHEACYRGSKEIVEILLNSKGYVNINIANFQKRTPLHIASMEGYKEIVELLIRRGADIECTDEEKCTPLALACRAGKTDVVELLIAEGANRNCLSGAKWSLLHIACQEEHKDLVKLLIKNGLDVNARNATGVSPLYCACIGGNKEIIEMLIAQNADVNITDNDGVSAMHIACVMGFEPIVKLLIEKGAEVDIVDKKGRTPIRMANFEGYKDIAVLLRKEKFRRILGKVCEERDIAGVDKLLRDMEEKDIPDEWMIKLIDVFGDRVTKALIKKVGNTRMSKILDKTEDKDICNRVVNEMYKRVSSLNVDGKAKALLQDKVYKDIRSICQKGTKVNDLRILLSLVDLTDEFLAEVINIAKCNALEVIVSKVDVDKISRVFDKIDKDKHNDIIDKLYQRRDILNLTKGNLWKVLEDKIRNELMEAHRCGRKQYRDILLNTGIDATILDEINVEDKREKVVPSSVHINTKVRVEDKMTLMEAIMLGDKDKIRLLKHNKNEVNRVDENGKSVLMYAIMKGYTELAKDLIEENADVHAKDNNNKSVLMYAIEKDESDIVGILINKGVDVYARDNNNKSVLMYAMQRGASMSHIIDPLIDEVSYEDKANDGVSILMCACQGGYMPAVKKLIRMVPEEECSSVLDYKIKGTTALRVAGENSNEEVAKCLLRNGAVDYGKLAGDKLNKLMAWWGKIDQERYNKDIEQISSRGNEGRSITRA